MKALHKAALIGVILALYSTAASAQLTNQGMLDQVVTEFATRATSWQTVVMNAAMFLFWTLGTISLVFTFGFMTLRKADIGEFFAEFIRFILFFGFFLWLLRNGPAFANSIIQSLARIGEQASGVAWVPDALKSDGAGMAAKRPWLALATLCLAVLVAQLDTGVVYLATRAIGDDLDAGIDVLQWIVDSYNLVYAVLLLTGGLLADLYGRRRVFMMGAGVFTVASLSCAAAPSASILIAARALTGFGAALLIPASLAIIRVVWRDPAERGRALGIWAACNGLAMAIGPTLGGLLIGHFGWRSIFLIVVPVSTAAFILAVPAFPESADPQGRQFDGLAQLFGAMALGGLAFAGIQSYNAPKLALAALLVAIVALGLFIRIESKKGAAALVPLDIFRSRTFCGAVTATAGMTFGMYGVLFLLPLAWLDTGRLSALGAGIALIPMSLVFVAVSPLSGPLTERYGARVSAAGGVAIIGIGLLLIAISSSSTSIAPSEVGLILAGLGMGLATGPLMGTAVGAVAAARSGTASALINVARMVGATVGVAVLGAVFTMAHSGANGLRTALLLGGAAEVGCAFLAWIAMRRS